VFDVAAFQALRRGAWGESLEWHDSIESTQDAMRDRVRHMGVETGAVIGAEAQSAGRGRWGRVWEGKTGQSLLFTLALPSAHLKGVLSQAPLVLGVGLQRALASLGQEGLALRWPNDLTWRGRKLAGLLVEQEGGQLLVGLGLNVGQEDDAFSPELRGVAASLKQAGTKELRREPLLALVLFGLEQAWTQWQSEGFEPLRLAWEAVAEGRGAVLKVQPTAGEPWSGTWLGLDGSGALRLRPQEGPARLLSSGEVQRLVFPERPEGSN
jgi:BirA family biotin operon repressor/biotin-[acetyl-CoA-carboxylase] ligase